MTIQSLDQSILSTLAYAAVFSTGVPRTQFHAWLHTAKRVTKKALFTRLKELEAKQLVLHTHGEYFFVPKINTQKNRREKISQEKIATMKGKLKFFTWIPWITGIGITGSVAALNAKDDDDLDLILITQVNRLWISRLCLSVVLFCLGDLRTHESHRVCNKLCLNVWLDEASLQFPKENLYIARELIQILWIYDTYSVQEKLLTVNNWHRNFFANTEIKKNTLQRKKAESPHIYRMITALNSIAFRLQVWYMGRHRSRETVEPGRALFHPKDMNGLVLGKYRQIFAQYKKSYNGKIRDKRKK